MISHSSCSVAACAGMEGRDKLFEDRQQDRLLPTANDLHITPEPFPNEVKTSCRFPSRHPSRRNIGRAVDQIKKLFKDSRRAAKYIDVVDEGTLRTSQCLFVDGFSGAAGLEFPWMWFT